jgi:16S rRNA processing protein RimM
VTVLGDQKTFIAGEVTATHGLRGELRVRPISGGTSALLTAERVLLRRGGDEPIEYRVQRVGAQRGQLLLKLAGLDRIEQVEGLIGARLLMPFADLPPLPADEFYWFELEGMTVADRRLGELGRIEELFETPAHDVYVVRGARGEVLIPAVAAMIVAVDRQTRRMTVDLPEGLVPETDDL